MLPPTTTHKIAKASQNHYQGKKFSEEEEEMAFMRCSWWQVHFFCSVALLTFLWMIYFYLLFIRLSKMVNSTFKKNPFVWWIYDSISIFRISFPFTLWWDTWVSSLLPLIWLHFCVRMSCFVKHWNLQLKIDTFLLIHRYDTARKWISTREIGP